VLESGQGTLVTSRDGTEYIDFVSEYSAAMYGHSHPTIHKAIHEAMDRGMNLGSVIGKEAEFASLIQKRFPSMELMRFTNSGTEATTLAVAAALAFTGRKQVRTNTQVYFDANFMPIHRFLSFAMVITEAH
jgi:glutamate-1-semialdehyde 2,1-aminomutase